MELVGSISVDLYYKVLRKRNTTVLLIYGEIRTAGMSISPTTENKIIKPAEI